MSASLGNLRVTHARKFSLPLYAAVFALVMSLAGCAGGASQRSNTPPPPPPRQDVEHRVQYQGETLQIISAWYTGKGSNWPLVKEANPGLRPQRINLGQTILIPGDLVVERRPMPYNFIRDIVAKSSKPRTNSVVEPAVELGTQPTEPAVSGGDTGVVTSPPDGPSPGEEIDLDAILKQQIEEQQGGDSSAAPSQVTAPTTPSAAEGEQALKDEAASIQKQVEAPAVSPPSTGTGSDAEREKLLDELLTQ